MSDGARSARNAAVDKGVEGRAIRGLLRYAGWGFALLAALFYAPLLLGWATFAPGDFTDHFLPFSLFQRAALVGRELPIWNPYTYSGHPFLADVQAAVYYPISNLILLLTLPVEGVAARLYWLQVEAVVHTALGGWFAFLWARRLTGDGWAGLLAGITFAFSGYLTGYAPLQLAVLRTAIWLPLLWWLLLRAWAQPERLRWWCGAALAAATLVLAGHSQTLLLAIYATAGWVAALMIGLRAGWRHGMGLIGVALLTVGLTAAQWWPSWEFAQHSVRADVDYTFVSGGFAWRDYWQLLLPRVLTQYSPVYIGIVGLVLVLAALFVVTARPRSAPPMLVNGALPWRVGIWFLVTLLLLALLASLGSNGPLYPLLYRFAPGWGWFRGQERAAYLVTVALAGLAAYGFALVRELAPGPRRRAAILGGVLVVGGTYIFGLLFQLAGRTAVGNYAYLSIAAITMILGLAAALIVWLPGWSTKRSLLLLGLAFVNLTWANVATNLTGLRPAERAALPPEVTALVAAVDEPTRDGLPGRVYNEYRVFDDYGMVVGIEDVWGSSPLRVARYAALFDQFPLDRMWRALGVSHVLTWRRELFGPSDLLGEFPQAEDTTYLHRLPDPAPRAWLARAVAAADDDVALAHLADHQFDLDATALVAPESAYATAAPPEASAAGGSNAEIQLARVAANALRGTVSNAAGGMLVLSEVWLPGWEVVDAVCDGAACPAADDAGRPYLLPTRVDLTLVGLWMPPGSVAFTLRYQPASVVYGAWISLAALLLTGAVLLWDVRPRRSRG